MAICGEPERAAREAGYKHPADRGLKLLCREDIAAEIKRCGDTLRAVYEDTAVCGLYRLAFSKPSDALWLLYNEAPSAEELELLDLSAVSEIKRAKDKSVEIKFFDRIKAVDKLNDLLHSAKKDISAGGLIEAMRLSAQTLGKLSKAEGDFDGD